MGQEIVNLCYHSPCVCVLSCFTIYSYVSHYVVIQLEMVQRRWRGKNIPKKEKKNEKSDNIIFIWLHSSEWNNVDFVCPGTVSMQKKDSLIKYVKGTQNMLFIWCRQQSLYIFVWKYNKKIFGFGMDGMNGVRRWRQKRRIFWYVMLLTFYYIRSLTQVFLVSFVNAECRTQRVCTHISNKSHFKGAWSCKNRKIRGTTANAGIDWLSIRMSCHFLCYCCKLLLLHLFWCSNGFLLKNEEKMFASFSRWMMIHACSVG